MVKSLKYLLVIIFFSSCNNSVEKTYKIKVRGFNFGNKVLSKYDMTVHKECKENRKLFIYSTDVNDTLAINKSNIYYRNILLKKIDSKKVKDENSEITIDKYFFESKGVDKYYLYLFINNEDGIIFTEYLNSGRMDEYNIQKFHKIHKAIALRQFGFKEGKVELQYAKMKYPD